MVEFVWTWRCPVTTADRVIRWTTARALVGVAWSRGASLGGLCHSPVTFSGGFALSRTQVAGMPGSVRGVGFGGQRRMGSSGRAPQLRQENPVGGRPWQLVHHVISCSTGTPKIAASRSTSSVVKPRCRPLRRPSAAHTVELLGQLICSPSSAWLHPMRWRRVRMFAPMTAH